MYDFAHIYPFVYVPALSIIVSKFAYSKILPTFVPDSRRY
jgi:hypothetical protein